MDEESLKGMTVNERLFHFGLLDEFDAAARSRDAPALIQVLLRARFSADQAADTANAVIADPGRYGF